MCARERPTIWINRILPVPIFVAPKSVAKKPKNGPELVGHRIDRRAALPDAWPEDGLDLLTLRWVPA